MSIDRTQLSKFLSLILRHKPDAIGLELDSQGWANIEQLIDKAHAAGTTFDRTELLHVVETSDKKRFSVSADRLRIRAARRLSTFCDGRLHGPEHLCLLGFPAGFGGVGIWWGLAFGLATAAILMNRRFIRRERLGLLEQG